MCIWKIEFQIFMSNAIYDKWSLSVSCYLVSYCPSHPSCQSGSFCPAVFFFFSFSLLYWVTFFYCFIWTPFQLFPFLFPYNWIFHFNSVNGSFFLVILINFASLYSLSFSKVSWILYVCPLKFCWSLVQREMRNWQIIKSSIQAELDLWRLVSNNISHLQSNSYGGIQFATQIPDFIYLSS